MLPLVTAMQRVCLALVVSILCTLVPLAYANPPDQTWRPGIFDDADFDDVMTFLTTTDSLQSAAPAAPLLLQIIVAIPRGAVGVLAASSAPSASSRAPPVPRAII